MKNLDDYSPIVGDRIISTIYKKARRLTGKRIANINSTFQGGGVAEILSSLVPLMVDAGIEVEWRILHAMSDFFNVTKDFHNALQGDELDLTEEKKELYIQTNKNYADYAIMDYDCIVVHDPQPLPLIKFYRKKQPWIWRLHIDFSKPNEQLWSFLKRFVLKYDKVIVSHQNYRRPDLPVEQKIFCPVIDPLSTKNLEISEKDMENRFAKFGIPTDKPLITQISRFDKWKDPIGVIEVFKKVRKEVDCRLILCGSMAADDPEGIQIYDTVREMTHELVEQGDVILSTYQDNLLVNALQRKSAVIIQKSTREGFGLTVTEALWKETPVVASNVGGIPLQIEDGVNGYLADPKDYDTFAERIVFILKNPDKAREMGKIGKEIVRNNFLTTRLMIDYLDLYYEVLYADF